MFRSLKEGLIVVGILLGYLASSQFIDSVGGWRYMYGLSLLPAILLGAGMVSSVLRATHQYFSSSLHTTIQHMKEQLTALLQQ